MLADRFMEKIKTGQLEEAFWLTMTREQRAEVAKHTMASLPNDVHQRYQQFRMDAKDVSELLTKGATLEFAGVETTGRDQGLEYAAVVYRVHGGDAKEHDGHDHGDHGNDNDRYVMVLASAYSLPPPSGTMWFIRQQNFAYKPHSYEPPKSGGHGHSH